MKTSGFGNCHLVGAKMECSKAGPFRGGRSLLGLPLSIGYDYDCKVCSLPVSLDQYFFRFDVVFYWPLCWPPGARAVVAMVQVA